MGFMKNFSTRHFIKIANIDRQKTGFLKRKNQLTKEQVESTIKAIAVNVCEFVISKDKSIENNHRKI